MIAKKNRQMKRNLIRFRKGANQVLGFNRSRREFDGQFTPPQHLLGTRRDSLFITDILYCPYQNNLYHPDQGIKQQGRKYNFYFYILSSQPGPVMMRFSLVRKWSPCQKTLTGADPPYAGVQSLCHSFSSG